MAHDVLISYSSKDKEMAVAICNKFETNKIKVWMAPRDITPGKSYAAEISRAIKSTKCVVLLFSSNSFSSHWVRKEIERAVGHGKVILPFLLENIELDDEWDLYISSAHWLDVMNSDAEKAIIELLNSVTKILGIDGEERTETEQDIEAIQIIQERQPVQEQQKTKVKAEHKAYEEVTSQQKAEHGRKNQQEAIPRRKVKQESQASKNLMPPLLFIPIGVIAVVFLMWGINQYKQNKELDHVQPIKQQGQTKVKSEAKAARKATAEGTFTDTRDGQTYEWVKIGNQVWMAENLNYKISPGSWCGNNESRNCDKYGRLYTWLAANKACPTGWRLPSESEWDKLIDFVGGRRAAGIKLKSKSGWIDNGNGTDEYGFSALPGGYRGSGGGYAGVFIDPGRRGYWWSSTETDNNGAYLFEVGNDRDAFFFSADFYKSVGYSVRCVRD